MSDLFTELSARARALSRTERERVAEELLASLADEGYFEVEAAWDRETRRRVDEAEQGVAKLVPAEEVFAEARRALGR